MSWITLFGCFIEILTFVIDGKVFFGSRILSYALNTFCFVGTCTVDYLWCLYVDLRIFKNVARIRKLKFPYAVPLLLFSNL